MFDAIKAQEMVVENLPEPPHPQEDEIEGKLEKLKRFNIKLAVKNENVANE